MALDVAEQLQLGSGLSAWLDQLDTAGPPPHGVHFPPPSEAADVLARLGLDEADRPDVLAALDIVQRSAPWTWLVERAYHVILRNIGAPETMPSMPNLPVSLGAPARCFWVLAFLAAVPDIRQWHQSQAISDQISWDTLADLGRHVRLYRQRNGHTGLDTPWWIALHFRGALFAIGRLQYAPYRLLTGFAGPLFWYDEAAAPERGSGFRRGDPAIGLHIPESGPLTPAVCSESFEAAYAFFQTHFPQYADAVVTCTSWLMDEQLLEYLEPTSNIAQFQSNFELVPGARDADDSAFHFVFGRGPESIDQLSPRTTLERAIVRHVQEGRHWRLRTGWLRLTTLAAQG